MSPAYSNLTPSFYTPIDMLGTVSVELAKGRFKDVVLVRNKTLRELGSQL